MNRLLDQFESVYIWDSEYVAIPGFHVSPVCMFATELRTGETFSRTWKAGELVTNPLSFGPEALHIVFSASADLGFALAAGWGLPHNVLDLWVEYRNLTNGLLDAQGNKLDDSLLGACRACGIWDITPEDKKEFYRERVIAGFPFADDEMAQILDYCAGDVRMTAAVAHKIVARIGKIDEALFRGRCMKGIVCMEWNGTPVRLKTYERLRRNSQALQARVIRNFEAEYKLGVFVVGDDGVVHQPKKNSTDWVRRMGFNGRTWTFNGEYASMDDKEVVEQKAVVYAEQFPEIEQYRQAKKFLSIAKAEFKFAIGPDGWNRTPMMAFRGSASRSQPKTSENIGNSSKPIRSLLGPDRPGLVLIHRDITNAEYGIPAALARDAKRWDNYLYKDAYLVKAADLGYCDDTATKATHRELRNQFKGITLAGQFGQTPAGLAKALGISTRKAEKAMARENRRYPAYQAWLRENDENRAFTGYVETELGWRLWVPLDKTKSMSSGGNAHLLRRAINHQSQGNCAEILRLWICLMTERGILVCNSMHDSVFFVAEESRWEETDALAVQCLKEACEFVLGAGYILKSDRDVVFYAEDYRRDESTGFHYGHYQHEDGKKMWDKIMTALSELEAEQTEEKSSNNKKEIEDEPSVQGECPVFPALPARGRFSTLHIPIPPPFQY
jgi:DNA polymerase-1